MRSPHVAAWCESVYGVPAGTFEIADPEIWELAAAIRPSPTPKVPVVEDAILRAVERAERPLAHKWFWPDAKPFCVFPSHDVDEVRWSWRRRLLMGARRPRTLLEPNDRYWNFDRILALERRMGVRSSWYFVADSSHPRDPPYRLADVTSVMQDLQKQGQEVGVHGSFLSYQDASMLRRQRELIGNVLGGPVPGVRQHFLNFEAPATWKAQEVAGFSYDTTLGLNEISGFRSGMCHPYVPPGQTILEVPLIIMDDQLFWWERFTLQQATENCRHIADEVIARAGLLTLDWHQHKYDRDSFPGWWDAYEELLGWLAARGALFFTGEELWRWWRARDAVSLRVTGRREGRTTWEALSPTDLPGFTLRFLGPPTATVHADAPSRLVEREDGTRFLVFQELQAGVPVTVAAE